MGSDNSIGIENRVSGSDKGWSKLKFWKAAKPSQQIRGDIAASSELRQDSPETIKAVKKAVESAKNEGIYHVVLDRKSIGLTVEQSLARDNSSLEVSVVPSLDADGALHGVEIVGRKRDQNFATVQEGKYTVWTKDPVTQERKLQVNDHGVYGRNSEGKVNTYASELPLSMLLGPLRSGVEVAQALQAVSTVEKKQEAISDKKGNPIIGVDQVPVLSRVEPSAEELRYRPRELVGRTLGDRGSAHEIASAVEQRKINGDKLMTVSERNIFDLMVGVVRNPLEARPSGMAPRPPGPRIA